MLRVGNDEFLKVLAQLLHTAESQGSVYLEQKRLTRHGADAKLDVHTAAPYPLIFRATDGARDKKKRKGASTVVAAADLDAFWLAYADALRAGMSGLLKKDKKDKKKARK